MKANKLTRINFRNITSFIEGNFKFYFDKMVGLPKYKKEQIIWRFSLCKNDCIKNDSCKVCGCPPKKKIYVNKSCNKGQRFPDLMDEKTWNKYKEDNNLVIDG